MGTQAEFCYGLQFDEGGGCYVPHICVGDAEGDQVPHVGQGIIDIENTEGSTVQFDRSDVVIEELFEYGAPVHGRTILKRDYLDGWVDFRKVALLNLTVLGRISNNQCRILRLQYLFLNFFFLVLLFFLDLRSIFISHKDYRHQRNNSIFTNCFFSIILTTSLIGFLAK